MVKKHSAHIEERINSRYLTFPHILRGIGAILISGVHHASGGCWHYGRSSIFLQAFHAV